MKLSEFNNKFLGVLEIELTEKAKPISKFLLNVSASSNAKIKSIKFIPFDDELNPLSKKDYDSIVIKRPSLTIKSESEVITFDAPNGEYFTARNLIKVIEKTERKTRKNSEWFGGIDVHHVFFEGLVREGKHYTIYWGS